MIQIGGVNLYAFRVTLTFMAKHWKKRAQTIKNEDMKLRRNLYISVLWW